MIYLYFIACLSGTPCEAPREYQNVRMTIQLESESDYISPYDCMMNGQIEMSKWFEMHPKYKGVKRWTCTNKEQHDL